MKKRRSTFWRWLLALLLGEGTWWGVGWWLSPRVHAHLRYAVSVEQGIPAHTEGPRIRPFSRHHARILDAEGKYLYVEERTERGQLHYEVIDLASKSRIARHEMEGNSIAREFMADNETQSNSQGMIFCIHDAPLNEPGRVSLHGSVLNRKRLSKIEEDLSISHKNQLTAPQILEWDVLKNQTRLLRQFSSDSVIKISLDGTTLLEIERTPPLFPTLLLPPSLPNFLACYGEMKIHGNDLALMHVYNLPFLQRRCTIAIPWIERQAAAELSHDGRFIVVTDSTTPDGFTSPTSFSTKEYHGFTQGGRGYVTSQTYYASLPLGIRVFDTASGKLWWESKKMAGIYTRCDAETPLIRFRSEIDANDVGPPELLLHLPSKSVVTTMASNSIAPLTASSIQFTTIDISNQDIAYEIHVINQAGHNQTTAHHHEEGLRLIPFAAHYLLEPRQATTPIIEIADWFHSHQWFLEWNPAPSWEWQMFDYAKQRMLLSQQSTQRPETTISYPWLLVTNNDETHFHVSVYALPFPSWSSVWPFTAGLVVFIIACYLLRQRRLPRG